MAFAPASIEFSRSSFTAAAGRCTTSPAAILFARCSGSILIDRDMILPGGCALRNPETGKVVEDEFPVVHRHTGERVVADQKVAIEIGIIGKRRELGRGGNAQ